MDDTVRFFDIVINDLREVDVKIVIIPSVSPPCSVATVVEIKRRTNTFAIKHVVRQDVSQRFWICQQRIKRPCNAANASGRCKYCQ